MKRIVAFVLCAYFVVGIALLLLKDPTPDVIHILSIERPFSLLVTASDEKIAFILYLDDEDCFLIDRTQIRSARLTDGSTELALSPTAIVMEATSFERDGMVYKTFRYEFGFDGVMMTTGTLVFTDATLELTYENDHVASYVVGDAEILFGQPGEPRYLDFTRLYGVFNIQNGVEAVAGIVIGIDAKTGTGIELTAVDLHFPGIAASLGDAVTLTDAVDYDTVAATLLNDPEWSLVGIPKNGSIGIVDSILLFIPIVHADRLHSATRFPVVLTYRYDGNVLTFAIDDFAFRSPLVTPEAYGEEVHAYEYRR